MQPHWHLNKLQHYIDIPGLHLWILDCLTNRAQCVKTEKECSLSIKSNTDGLQGCVHSVFFFVVYTNNMSENTDNGKIIKYADSTVVAGLIRNDDECHYRKSISY